jgi:hypothetical protein
VDAPEPCHGTILGGAWSGDIHAVAIYWLDSSGRIDRVRFLR